MTPEKDFIYQHPIRRKVLHIIAQKAMTVTQVARELDLHPANIIYHFRVLEKAKLIRLIEEKNLGRNIEKYYVLTGCDSVSEKIIRGRYGLWWAS